MQHKKSAVRWLGVWVIGIVLFSGMAYGRHQATIILKDGAGSAQGEVRYLPSKRSYEIARGGITREVRARDVERLILAEPPAQLEPALRNVQQGRYQQAIPELRRIVEEYTMFGPDVQAAQGLMQAYLRTNRSSDALKTAEELLRMNPDLQKNPGFAAGYWEALLEEGRTATLQTALSEAIQTGSRSLAAVALLRRGDVNMREGNPREALVDGYLRVVLLFRDVSAVQPEALYKAMEAHQEQNEVTYAERWRQRLLTNYGTSEFAQRLK